MAKEADMRKSALANFSMIAALGKCWPLDFTFNLEADLEAS